MRAFNLIPADERGGGCISAGKSGGSAFVVLGVLGVLAIFALLYGEASRQISSQTGKIATLNAQAQAAQAQAAKLAPYVSFKTMHEQRVQAVDQLVDSRFDWAHAFHELGRVLPPGQVSLSSLSGTIGVERRFDLGRRRHGRGREQQSRRRDRRDDTGRGQLRRGGDVELERVLGDARRQRPHVHARRLRDEPVDGRADARPPAADRRGQRSHAAELDPGCQERRRQQQRWQQRLRGGHVRDADHLRPAAERLRDELPEHDADRDAERADACHRYTNDIDRSGTMTGRDRIVIVVIAALAVMPPPGCSSSPPSAKRRRSSAPKSAPRSRS